MMHTSTIGDSVHELRCGAKLHGVVLEPDVLEVACNSRWCGWRKGTVVRHRIRISTGDLIVTKLYRARPNPDEREAE